MYAVTDPDCEEDADEATGAESSSDEGEDAGPESSNDETDEEVAGSSDEVAPPAPSSGRPRSRRRQAPKKKSRVDEVGVSRRKRTTHPLIFHNLLCEVPQTLIFVAAPP